MADNAKPVDKTQDNVQPSAVLTPGAPGQTLPFRTKVPANAQNEPQTADVPFSNGRSRQFVCGASGDGLNDGQHALEHAGWRDPKSHPRQPVVSSVDEQVEYHHE